MISYFAPERANFLEYDLTRLVNDLANPEKPVVALLGDLPLMGTQFNQYQPWHVLEAMYQFFDVRVLGGKQERIDDDVQVLMLAQPHNVDPATLYAIDQFVMRGGRVLAFIDPLAEVMAAGGGMNPMANPEGDAIKALEPLLAAWGITIPDGQVIGDRTAAQRVSAQVGGRQVVVDYLPWLSLDRSHLNADDVTTGDIRVVNLNSAGSIQAREGDHDGGAAGHVERAVDGDRRRPDPHHARPGQADRAVYAERQAVRARGAGRRPGQERLPGRPPAGDQPGRAPQGGEGAAQSDRGRRCRPARGRHLGARRICSVSRS